MFEVDMASDIPIGGFSADQEQRTPRPITRIAYKAEVKEDAFSCGKESLSQSPSVLKM